MPLTSILAVGLCMLISTESLAGYVPLEKFQTEPEAFLEKVQTLGGKLIVEAEETLNKENLSPEEQSQAIDKMLWGLKFKYGNDWNVFAEKLISFCDSLTEEQFQNQFVHGLYSQLLGLSHRMVLSLAVEGHLAQEDFEKICDTAVLIRNKFLNKMDARLSPFYKSSMENILIWRIADAFDPDATRGFVQLAAEKLGLDPDKPSDSEGRFDDSTFGTIRRTRLLGQQLEMSGVDKDGNTVDIKQFRSKPVLLVATDRMSEANQSISNKLYELLQNEGLVMLKVQPNTAVGGVMLGGSLGAMPTRNRPVTDEDAAAFSGTVVASPFHDFYHCVTPHFILTQPYLYPSEKFCLFLLDAQGKVVRLQNSGYDAALLADLKELFPAKEAELSALLPIVQANQDRWTDEKNKRCVVFQSKKLDDAKKQLLMLFEVIDPGHNDHIFRISDHYKNVRSADSQWYQWHYSGLIFPAFQGFPDFPEVSPELRFRILYATVKARQVENAYRSLGDINVLPEVISKPLNDDIKKWNEDYPNHPFWYEFFAERRGTVSWLMMERLRKLPDSQKKEYAEVVFRELFSLAEEFIPTGDRRVGSDFRVIIPMFIRELQGVEFDSIDDGVIADYKRQFFVLITTTSTDVELFEFAVRELR
jgi:hypothetical protein